MKNLIESGRYLFALAIIGIGVVHIVTGNFPVSLLPVPAFAGKILLVYVVGLILIAGGISLLIDRVALQGSIVIGILFLLLFIFPHLLKLFSDFSNPGEWTVAAETLALCSGAFIMIPLLIEKSNSIVKSNPILKGIVKLAPYVFALTLIVFAVQHYLYADFISKIVPSWIPAPLFITYLVMVVFILTSFNIFLNRRKRESAIVFGTMFLIMFALLHVPRVLNNLYTETEWTSMFIALAMSGIGFMLAHISVNVITVSRPNQSFG